MMKESQKIIDKQIVLFDGFSSDIETRNNGGIPSNITYSNGIASFNGSSSKIAYRTFSGVKSVRIIFTPSTTTQNILKLSSTHSISVSGGTVSATGFSSPTIYVNGVAGTTITASKVEVVVTTATAIRATDIQLGYISSYLTGTVELLSFYNSTLSSDECINLYQNKRHRELNFNTGGRKLILDVNAFSGVVRNTLSGNTYNELVTNGGFDTDTWWSKDTGWTISNGVASINTASSGIALYKAAFLTVGKTYRFEYTITSYTSGEIVAYIGSATGTNRSSIGSYSETITAASNGYVGLRSVASAILSIDNVSVKEVIPSVVNTAVTVVKENDLNVMRFNGTTSKIDCGSYDTLVGDKTFVVWVNHKEYLLTPYVRILNNGKVFMWVDSFTTSNKRFGCSSDGSTLVYSANGSFVKKKNILLIITRTSTGVTNFYVDGALSGTANQSLGTPAAGTTNIIIGNNTIDYYNGLIFSVRIIDGLLTAQEINQLYHSERSLYGQ